MPPTKKPPRSGGKTKSSPSRAREVAGGVKKLGSLSSVCNMQLLGSRILPGKHCELLLTCDSFSPL
jgi:hypothetical protein